LEISSRDEYSKYANAGTINNNYANILVLLLRLRQACNHSKMVEKNFVKKFEFFSIFTGKEKIRIKSKNKSGVSKPFFNVHFM
jgi:SNF2 family DNA or RNA helicase